jgi:hypothetical protein
VRFASAHKLVTYLLVLAALAAVASTRALAPASALAFLGACALSFSVEGSRVAQALDRAAVVVRAIAIALFASISCWRCSGTSCSSGAPTATTCTSRR